MKKKIEITYCEYCDEQIPLESPPSKERYNSAGIVIDAGTMLLPDDVHEYRKEKGLGGGHAVDLSGYYCSPVCLRNFINDILITEEENIKYSAMQDYLHHLDKAMKPLKADRYKILGAATIQYLEEKINRATAYKPVGGVSAVNDSSGDSYTEYLQLMERCDD